MRFAGFVKLRWAKGEERGGEEKGRGGERKRGGEGEKERVKDKRREGV